MKKLIYPLLLILLQSNLLTWAQQKSYTLNSDESGSSKTYVARDYISLKPGFHYIANSTNSFKAKIDELLVFLPTQGITGGATGYPGTSEGMVGAISGSASVGAVGGATYSIPIKLPNGINGIQPNLGIVYNSQGGNGLLGLGAQLSGLSAIIRVPYNPYYDNENYHPVSFDGKDKYALNGQRLLTNGSGVYFTENDPSTRIIESTQKKGDGPEYFTVETKSGMTMEFGKPTAGSSSAIILNGHTGIYIWLLNKIYDKNGNYIQFKYGQNAGEFWINEIEYTGTKLNSPFYKIKFNYKSRQDEIFSIVDGVKIKSTKLLDEIVVFYGTSVLYKYHFNYTFELNTLLHSISLENGNAEKINSTIFEWSEQINFSNNSIISAEFAVPGDFNNDGLADLYVILKENGKYYQAVRWNNNGYLSAPTAKTEIESTYDVLQDAFDYNGDGKMDTYRKKYNGYYYPLLSLSNGSGFQALLPFGGPFGSNFKSIAGDFNGNGKDDILIIFPNGECRMASHGTSPKTLALNNVFYSNVYNKVSKFHKGDFNGDGKLDIGFFMDGKFYAINTKSDGMEIILSLNFSGGEAGDFNGDGLTDFINLSNNGKYYIRIIKGTSFETLTGTLPVPDEPVYERYLLGKTLSDLGLECRENNYFRLLKVTDFNFDGKSDLTYTLIRQYEFYTINGDEFNSQQLAFLESIPNISFPERDMAEFVCNNYLEVAYSNGSNAFQTLGVYSESSVDLRLPSKLSPIVADFNGDGLPELYLVNNKYSFVPRLKQKRYFISKITDGLNNSVSFKYKTLNDPKNPIYKTSTNAVFPIKDFNGSVMVVDKIIRSNGVSNDIIEQYTYEGAKIHVKGRGFLGFTKATIKNTLLDKEITNIKKLNTKYYMFVPYLQISKVNGKTTATSTSQVTVDSRANKKYLVKIDAVKTTDIIKSITINKFFTYDYWGNILTERTEYQGTGSVLVTNQYTAKGAWCPNKIDFSTTKYTRGSETKTRSIDYNYDYTTGNLIKVIKDPGDPNQLITEYSSYNSYGKPEIIKTTASGYPTRETKYTYTPSGRFIQTITNNLGQKQTNYFDEKWGVKTAETGFTGLTTTFQYDNWGHLYKTTSPEGINKISALRWSDGNGPSGAVYYNYEESSGSSPVTVWYDNTGRELRKEVFGFNQQKIIIDTYYETNGNLKKVSDPYYSGETPAYTFYTFDEYGREIKKELPTGDVISSSYSGSDINIVAPNTNIRKSYNSMGEIVKSTDNISNQNVIYSYYPDGLLKSVKPSTGPPVLLEYDLQGNRTKITDADAGVITSKTNGFGDMIWKEDNKGKRTTYIYDSFGRLKSETLSNESTINYSYTQKNRIKSISDDNHAISYQYDTYGRLTQITESVGSEQHTSQIKYDAFGNVSKETYPSGFYITNSYDKYGLLTEIKDKDGKRIWKVNSMNALGQYKSVSKGNGKTTTYSYDARHMPKTISTAGIAQFEYGFNPVTGNLTYRKDTRRNLREDFTYDNLNRLTGAKIQGEPSNYLSLRYAENGNIVLKSDAADSLIYDNVKPHAVVKLLNYKNIPSLHQDIKYTAFNKVKSITEGDYRIEFTYGTDRLRRKTILKNKNTGAIIKTKYFFGNYEKEIDAQGKIRELHYIAGGDGLAAVFIKDASHPQGKLYYTYSDYLGSIIAFTDETGTLLEEQSFDPWGRRRNIANWTYTNIQPFTILDRGYTGHQHLYNFGIINMNGRLYDPVLGRMLSPDNFIQMPGFTQNFNRYSYVLNNPLSFTDPDGEFFWIPFGIGAIIGGYSGYKVGEAKGAKGWSMAGYIFGGAAIGGLSGALGAEIAASGVFMANTTSIMAGSYMNSAGMAVLSGGMIQPSVSFGFGSYNFGTGEFNYLFDGDNKWYEDLGYGLGAIANISDILKGFHTDEVQLQTENLTNATGKDNIGHSQLVDTKGNSLVDFGPGKGGDFYKFNTGRNNWTEYASGGRITQTKDIPGNIFNTPQTIKGVNINLLRKYSSWLNKKPGFYNFALRSCSTQAARGLTLSGVPVFGIHPYLLRFQIANGLRPYMFNYTYTNGY